MKKLLSIAFIAVTTFFAASAAEAQTGRNNRNVNQGKQRQIGNYNSPVRTYTQTKNVVIGRKHYRDTYRVTVLRNGKTTSKLVSRVLVKKIKNQYVQPAFKTTYQTVIVREKGKIYRVTYKIMKYRNGKTVKQIASKVRVR